jgi:hypothetical protein
VDKTLLYGFLDLEDSAFRPSENPNAFPQSIVIPSKTDLFIRCMEAFVDFKSRHYLRNWCIDVFGSFDGTRGAYKYLELKSLCSDSDCVEPTVLEAWKKAIGAIKPHSKGAMQTITISALAGPSSPEENLIFALIVLFTVFSALRTLYVLSS